MEQEKGQIKQIVNSIERVLSQEEVDAIEIAFQKYQNKFKNARRKWTRKSSGFRTKAEKLSPKPKTKRTGLLEAKATPNLKSLNLKIKKMAVLRIT